MININTLTPAQYRQRSCIRSLLCGADIDLIRRELEVRESAGDVLGRQVVAEYLEEVIADME